MLRICFGALVALTCAGQARAEETAATRLREGVVGTSPEVRVEHVDHETLRVHRLDIVDANGVIRMTLAGDLPNPIIDGVEWRRSTPVGGLMLRDDNGNERGGFGYASRYGAVVFALDHNNGEAAGFNTLPDGSANMILISRPPQARDIDLGDRLVPSPSTTPVQVSVGPDGAPALTLRDSADRPRIRIRVTSDGYGMIEFLDAEGNVVDQLAPEQTPNDQRRTH